MNTITNIIEKKVGPVAMKISNMKYIRVIKSAFQSTITIVIIGSIASLIVAAPVDSSSLDPGIAKTICEGWEWLKSIFFVPFKGIYSYTVGIYAVYIAGCCGYEVGKINKMNPMLSFIIGVASFLSVSSLTQDGTITTDYFGNAGLVCAMFFSILGVELMSFIYNKEIGKIDLSQYGAPPTLSDAFRILTPTVIVLLLFSLLGYLCLSTFGPLPTLLTYLLSPLISVSDSVWFMAFAAGAMGLFWWFGIHDGVINSIINPVLSVMLLANMDAFTAGVANADLPYVGSRGLLWIFLLCYGIFPLTTLCLFSKSKQIKTMGKVGILPSIFAVSEPMVFGLPICYNPYFLIPYVLVPMLNVGIAYIATDLDLINRVIAYYTSTVPAPIHAFIATFDVRAVILVLLLYVLDAMIYYPFLKMYEKSLLAAEQQEMEAEKQQKELKSE